ncbi:hypothetical protein JCM11641_005516 [Rhodosporidiobolus odoratus]
MRTARRPAVLPQSFAAILFPSIRISARPTACGDMTITTSTSLLDTTAYSVVIGSFIQSSPSFPSNDPAYDPLQDSFGLINKSASRWDSFKRKIEQLNEESDENTAVKVIYLARHGQGYHNVAESNYGTKDWDDHWSKLNGDGQMVWGPDPLLTPLGINQAKRVNRAWKEQQQDHVPLPQSLYSSPLSRAASTLDITWQDVLLGMETGVEPLFVEGLRETIGAHTCDKRKSKSYLASTYPSFTFEKGFAEEDELWSPTERESDAEQAARIRSELNKIFATDASQYISITAHGGVINAFFSVVGHRKVAVPPGGMIPIVQFWGELA